MAPRAESSAESTREHGQPGALPGGAAARTVAVRAKARELGFSAVGVARADEPLEREHARYLEFVERGLHGDMAYLAAEPEARRRLDGEAILPGARSVVVLATRYQRAPDDEAADPPLARTIARYARGHDYHNGLRKKLRRLAAFVRTLEPGARARPLQDVEPLLERAWAARAGLGFVGKNGLVIVPGQGSFVLLGEVVSTVELTPDDPMTERCGSCTRCLDACPTQAFVAPFVLDPRRCVSYLTLEASGPVPPSLREAVAGHLVGCDLCQDVCPYNRASPPPSERTRAFRPLPVWSELPLSELVAATDHELDRLLSGSPARRPGAAGIAERAALVAHAWLRDPIVPEAQRVEAEQALERAVHGPHEAAREAARWSRATRS